MQYIFSKLNRLLLIPLTFDRQGEKGLEGKQNSGNAHHTTCSSFYGLYRPASCAAFSLEFYANLHFLVSTCMYVHMRIYVYVIVPLFSYWWMSWIDFWYSSVSDFWMPHEAHFYLNFKKNFKILTKIQCHFFTTVESLLPSYYKKWLLELYFLKDIFDEEIVRVLLLRGNLYV